MVFSSSTFLFAFMPLFFAVYFMVPQRKARNVWLLVASLFFYAWGEPVYVLLMMASILANWLFGLVIGRMRGGLAAAGGDAAGKKQETPPPDAGLARPGRRLQLPGHRVLQVRGVPGR